MNPKASGVIINDETGKDIFVYATALNGGVLHEGDKVEYQEKEGKKA